MSIVIFLIVFIISVICLVVFKKINPEKFKVYLIWVLLIVFIALVIYRPWMTFI